MPHYSIPVSKNILCWADIDHEGTLEEAIEYVKTKIKEDDVFDLDLNEGLNEEYEYKPHEEHYCDEELVK